MSKVYWGIEKVHYAILDETTGTYETPIPIQGAVNLGLSAEGDQVDFYADNIKYFNASSNNGYSGDLEMAKFTDQFLEDALGWTIDSNGAVAELSSAIQKPFALLFEIKGDTNNRRYVYYNVKASRPSRTHATQSESIEVGTETATLSIIPKAFDDVNYIGQYLEPSPTNATAYQQWFTTVYEPQAGE